MDSNIIEDFRNVPVDERTNDVFDSLLRTLEIVWGNKVYQEGLLQHLQACNRELYDLSMTMAQGLVSQDNGSKVKMIKFKNEFKRQCDEVISCNVINKKDVLLTRKHLRQICMYYLDKESIFFSKTTSIQGCLIDLNYMFSFGEVVVPVSGGDEVVVVNEEDMSIHYVTYDMLKNEDGYILPIIAVKTSYMSLPSGVCIIVNKDIVDIMHNEYTLIFDTITL